MFRNKFSNKDESMNTSTHHTNMNKSFSAKNTMRYNSTNNFISKGSTIQRQSSNFVSKIHYEKSPRSSANITIIDEKHDYLVDDKLKNIFKETKNKLKFESRKKGSILSLITLAIKGNSGFLKSQDFDICKEYVKTIRADSKYSDNEY